VQFSKNFPLVKPTRCRSKTLGPRAGYACLLSIYSLLIFALFPIPPSIAGPSANAGLPWAAVAKKKPNLKILVLVKGHRPFSLTDLTLLSDRGLTPADRDPGLILGKKRGVFKSSLKRWIAGPPLPEPLKAELLERFQMSGIYRVGFKVEEIGYRGPLNLEATAPRDGFGQKLLASETVVRPAGPTSIRIDSAGNRWLRVNYPDIRQGQTIHLHFSFTYLVEMSELLAHDLFLAGDPLAEELPPEVLPFLKRGKKIDPALPAAVSWAETGNSGPPDARREFTRLSKFLLQTVTYDQCKKQQYFGGQSVYSDLDQMYQDLSVTLTRRMGACPDTVLLECSFLRARGIPCRTAGRFGHFFSLVYLPGRGWMSASVLPTGIPLIISPGPDHIPYQTWTPRIALRTTQWEGKFRIETLEEPNVHEPPDTGPLR
jgi:hypothetical protein